MGTVVSAFAADHVARMTGLTARQLAYWDRTGFFRPNHSQIHDGAGSLKLYSFADVVGLRVISVLLNEHGISVQTLRKVADELSRRADHPWSGLKLMVCKGEVSVVDPATGHGEGVFSGQYVLVPIIDQIKHVEREAVSLSKRGRDQIGIIHKRRNVAHNAPVFAGTRVPIRAIHRYLDAGYSVEAVLKEYPSLERGDIEAAVQERGKPAAA